MAAGGGGGFALNPIYAPPGPRGGRDRPQRRRHGPRTTVRNRNTLKNRSRGGAVGLFQDRKLDNSRKARKGRKYKPFVAPDGPPPGTYDPVLDATLRAAHRGLGDFQRDTERDTTRRAGDLSLATGIVNTDRSQALGDIIRNYRNLGVSETSAGAAQGVLDGGFLAAAARQRAENSGREKFRTNQGADRRIADLTLQNERAGEDSTTALDRAQREFGFFKSDTQASELYQAKQTGWVPPERPKSQRKFGHQVVQIQGGNVILPNGTIMSREEARQRFATRDRETVGDASTGGGIGLIQGPPVFGRPQQRRRGPWDRAYGPWDRAYRGSV